MTRRTPPAFFDSRVKSPMDLSRIHSSQLSIQYLDVNPKPEPETLDIKTPPGSWRVRHFDLAGHLPSPTIYDLI